VLEKAFRVPDNAFAAVQRLMRINGDRNSCEIRKFQKIGRLLLLHAFNKKVAVPQMFHGLNLPGDSLNGFRNEKRIFWNGFTFPTNNDKMRPIDV
jgi:hypothetical protein